jgi:hypothetical protein
MRQLLDGTYELELDSDGHFNIVCEGEHLIILTYKQWSDYLLEMKRAGAVSKYSVGSCTYWKKRNSKY